MDSHQLRVAMEHNFKIPQKTIIFRIESSSEPSEVARISPDGIMRFTVEANDENAARFVECIERLFGERLAGVDVVKKSV